MTRFKSVLLFTGAMLATVSGFTTAASAATTERWADTAYMAASRCAGLAQGSKLDTSKLDALLKDQGNGRIGYVSERADTLRDEADRRARHASGAVRQSIDAELAGPCQSYLKAAS